MCRRVFIYPRVIAPPAMHTSSVPPAQFANEDGKIVLPLHTTDCTTLKTEISFTFFYTRKFILYMFQTIFYFCGKCFFLFL